MVEYCITRTVPFTKRYSVQLIISWEKQILARAVRRKKKIWGNLPFLEVINLGIEIKSVSKDPVLSMTLIKILYPITIL